MKMRQLRRALVDRAPVAVANTLGNVPVEGRKVQRIPIDQLDLYRAEVVALDMPRTTYGRHDLGHETADGVCVRFNDAIPSWAQQLGREPRERVIAPAQIIGPWEES